LNGEFREGDRKTKSYAIQHKIKREAGSKVKNSQPHNYYGKDSVFQKSKQHKQRVSLSSVF
jgi:hypothetical protein